MLYRTSNYLFKINNHITKKMELMEVIIYLVVSVAIVFVPYYVGRLCIKDFGGNLFIDWFFGLAVSFLIVTVILVVITTSNVIINAI